MADREMDGNAGMLSMDEQRSDRERSGWWQRLTHWVNGDREDSRGQYLAFALVILFCIVLGVVIDVLAG